MGLKVSRGTPESSITIIFKLIPNLKITNSCHYLWSTGLPGPPGQKGEPGVAESKSICTNTNLIISYCVLQAAASN